MIRIRDISLPPQQDMAQLVYAAARQLRIDHTQIKQLDIKKRSVDARKKTTCGSSTPWTCWSRAARIRF